MTTEFDEYVLEDARAASSRRPRSSAMSRRRSPRWSGCRARRSPMRSARSACRSSSARCACSSSGTGSMCAASRASTPMTSVSKELRAALEARFTLERPEVVAEQVSVDGTRKWLLRLPGEHAGERPHEVECVYIPDAGRATLVRLEPGRLHAHLLVLPHRHAAPGAQPHPRRDRRAGDGRARPARRLAGRRRRPKARSCRPTADASSPTSS